MASHAFVEGAKSLTRGTVTLYGSVTLGSSGAISSSVCNGFSIAKTASETGRYTVTLAQAYPALLGVACLIEGAIDAAYTTAKGQWNGLVRNVAVSTARTFDIQMQRTDTGADAEIEDGLSFSIAITLMNSNTNGTFALS
jgi:hypothetical protein